MKDKIKLIDGKEWEFILKHICEPRAARKSWSKTSTGCACVFIQRGTVGYKLYKDSSNRNNSYFLQRKAGKYAPKVGKRFNAVFNFIRNNSNHEFVRYYGYTTQVAKMKTKWNPDKNAAVKKLTSNVAKKLKLGFYGDTHPGNIGKIGNRYVIIDFDKVSTGKNNS